MGASENGHLRAVEHLIAANADPNAAGHNGVTALMLASINCHCHGRSVAVVKALIAPGAAVNASSTNGGTAILWASCNSSTPIRRASNFYRSEEVVKVLTAADADINHADNAGLTPIACALMSGHHGISGQLVLGTSGRSDPHPHLT